MKKISLSIIMALCLTATAFAQHPDPAASRQQRLTDHVYYFAADSLNGRKAGSEDAAKAAEYIRQEYEAAGLKPYFDTWEMHFNTDGKEYMNIVGVIEGNDPQLKNEYIVLGAHYDHLGIKKEQIYNGADDNASGSAALIEVARILKSNEAKLKRSVIIAAFDAEELGLFGSFALSKALDSANVNVKLMMSVDMVGWLKAGKTLKLEGAATIKDGKKLLKAEAAKCELAIDPISFETSLFTATDTEGFAQKQVPTLAITTGTKSPYHKPGDDADLIDYEGLDKVTGYIADLTLATASQDRLEASGRVAAKHRGHLPYFEIGAIGGIGSSWLSFTDACFSGKSRFSYGAGVAMQLNYKGFGLQVCGINSICSAPIPNDDAPFEQTNVYTQKSTLMPVTLLYQSKDFPGGPFIGIGGYYNMIYDQYISYEGVKLQSYDSHFSQNGYGCHWCFGMRLGRFQVADYFFYQIDKVFPAGPAAKAVVQTPNCRLRSCMFSISYML